MSVPVLPIVITGPGVIQHNGVFHHFKKDVTVEDVTESFEVESGGGVLDTRHKSRMFKITATPVGELRSTTYINKLYPFGPADIGKSIFPTVAADAVVRIYSIPEGKTYAYNRGGISKFPEMFLSPTKTAFGAMEFLCIGKAATLPTDAAFLKTVATASLADASFDDATIVTDIYTATLGERGAPYDAMGSMDGFIVRPMLTVKPIPAGDIGIADIRVGNLGLECEFAPSNLTEEQVDVLKGIQGTDAVLVGQSYAKANEDLIIASDYFTATLYKMGAKDSSQVYEATEHRHKKLLFTNKRAGALYSNANPLWLFEKN